MSSVHGMYIFSISSTSTPQSTFASICLKFVLLLHRFYCRAIKLNSTDLSLWYELSLNYYNRSIKYGTSETRKKHLDMAAEVAKHIIKEAPHKWKYWNLLGVICTTKGEPPLIFITRNSQNHNKTFYFHINLVSRYQ